MDSGTRGFSTFSHRGEKGEAGTEPVNHIFAVFVENFCRLSTEFSVWIKGEGEMWIVFSAERE